MPHPGLASVCSQLVTKGSQQDKHYLAHLVPSHSTKLEMVLPSAEFTVSNHLSKDHGAAEQVHIPGVQVEGHRAEFRSYSGVGTGEVRQGGWAGALAGSATGGSPDPESAFVELLCPLVSDGPFRVVRAGCMMMIQQCRHSRRLSFISWKHLICKCCIGFGILVL